MHTPWGESDHNDRVVRGVTFVSTPGHGGLMIAKGFANDHLSNAAKSRGESYGQYLAYEEDCQYAIAMYELIETYYEEFQRLYSNKRTIEDWKEQLFTSLSRWNPDYLLEMGITPQEESYREYQQEQEKREMRKNKNPDFIVAALLQDDGSVKVWTADDQIYFVTRESYKKSDHLLSQCKKIGASSI